MFNRQYYETGPHQHRKRKGREGDRVGGGQASRGDSRRRRDFSNGDPGSRDGREERAGADGVDHAAGWRRKVVQRVGEAIGLVGMKVDDIHENVVTDIRRDLDGLQSQHATDVENIEEKYITLKRIERFFELKRAVFKCKKSWREHVIDPVKAGNTKIERTKIEKCLEVRDKSRRRDNEILDIIENLRDGTPRESRESNRLELRLKSLMRERERAKQHLRKAHNRLEKLDRRMHNPLHLANRINRIIELAGIANVPGIRNLDVRNIANLDTVINTIRGRFNIYSLFSRDTGGDEGSGGHGSSRRHRRSGGNDDYGGNEDSGGHRSSRRRRSYDRHEVSAIDEGSGGDDDIGGDD